MNDCYYQSFAYIIINLQSSVSPSVTVVMDGRMELQKYQSEVLPPMHGTALYRLTTSVRVHSVLNLTKLKLDHSSTTHVI